MNKVIVINDGETNVYDIVPPATAASTAALSGVTDPSLYQEFPESDFDEACYNYPNAFTLVSGTVGFSLPLAKERASQVEKQRFDAAEIAATVNYSPNQLASQAALPEIDRLPEIQLVIDAVNAIAVELSANLAAIDAAANIDEVNAIVYPPSISGQISLERNGLALEPSDFVTLVGCNPEDLVLYIPASTPVSLNYNPATPGYSSTGSDVFDLSVPPSYICELRYATNVVGIFNIEDDLTPTVFNFDFTPVIPS